MRRTRGLDGRRREYASEDDSETNSTSSGQKVGTALHFLLQAQSCH